LRPPSGTHKKTPALSRGFRHVIALRLNNRIYLPPDLQVPISRYFIDAEIEFDRPHAG
jgi:hypothetical protein